MDIRVVECFEHLLEGNAIQNLVFLSVREDKEAVCKGLRREMMEGKARRPAQRSSAVSDVIVIIYDYTKERVLLYSPLCSNLALRERAFLYETGQRPAREQRQQGRWSHGQKAAADERNPDRLLR